MNRHAAPRVLRHSRGVMVQSLEEKMIGKLWVGVVMVLSGAKKFGKPRAPSSGSAASLFFAPDAPGTTLEAHRLGTAPQPQPCLLG